MTSRKILGIAETLAGSAVNAARHPLATAGYVAGLAKGVTEATLDVVRGDTTAAPPMPARRAPDDAQEPRPPAGERTLYGGLNTEAAPPRSPGGGGEPVVHEQHAESREAAHGQAAVDPREVDSWTEEAEEGVDTTGADLGLDPDDGPLLDPATAKAVRSEAETLARAADPDKG